MPERRDADKSVDSELEQLNQAEWEDLYLRLRYFAYKFYPHLAKQGTILEDLIHDSIVDARSGKRLRPPGLPIFIFICGIMRSNTSHHFERESRRAKLNGNRQSANVSWDSSVQQENLRLDLSSTMKRVEDEIKDDKELNIIHRSMIDDPESRPQEIARTNNLSVDKVKNARKRYFRLVKKLLTA